MSQDDISFSDEFNATAKAFCGPKQPVNLFMLLTKYTLLQKHKVQDPQAKEVIAEALFDCGVDFMQKIRASNEQKRYIVNLEDSKAMTSVFEKLLEPESRNFIPSTAPDRLVNAALDLLRRAEALDLSALTETATWNYKNGLTTFAETALSFAEQFQEALQPATAQTTQDFKPAKVLTLKPTNGT